MIDGRGDATICPKFDIQLLKCPQVEGETLPEEETKEETDDEDEEDEESGRVRFRSERKEGVVVRLADASKRRNIPETLGTVCSCPG